MSRRKNPKCQCCKKLFTPDYRNRGRQRHCAQPVCRKAAKVRSQRRWLARSENESYFRGPENTRRVQQWRREHPGYGRKKKAASEDALQERCSAQCPVEASLAPPERHPALQDACLLQPAVLVGLISVMTGSALQEDIARSARSFFARGQDILGMTPGISFVPTYENQTHSVPSTAAARAAPV